LFGLRLRTARLELRLADEAELRELGAVALRGVHPPEVMPFRIPWTDRGDEDVVAGMSAYHRQARESWRPQAWSLALVVFGHAGPMGAVDVRGEDFAERREVETGSWLGQAFQGRGIGTEMREAALAFAFGGLGARAAVSGGFDFNTASLRIAEKLGYDLVGERTFAPRGEPQRELVMRLTREEWERRAHPPVEIEGLEPCLPLFGL
jgi:RimJ/RimL family protein N-acetyltransferase